MITYLPLTLLLVGAFLVTMASGHLQHRYYMKTVNRMATRHRRSGIALVSGVGRGRLRGAIVVLAVRRGDGAVEEALVMEGASVFARFRDSAALRGRRLGSPDMAAGLSGALGRALQSATGQYRQLQEPDEAAVQEERAVDSTGSVRAAEPGFVGPFSWLVAKARGLGRGPGGSAKPSSDQGQPEREAPA